MACTLTEDKGTDTTPYVVVLCSERDLPQSFRSSSVSEKESDVCGEKGFVGVCCDDNCGYVLGTRRLVASLRKDVLHCQDGRIRISEIAPCYE